jgi:hypothetical protein
MLWGTRTMPTVRPAIRSPVAQPRSGANVRGVQRGLGDKPEKHTVVSNPAKDREEAAEVVDDEATGIGPDIVVKPVCSGDDGDGLLRIADDTLSIVLKGHDASGGRKESRTTFIIELDLRNLRQLRFERRVEQPWSQPPTDIK